MSEGNGGGRQQQQQQPKMSLSERMRIAKARSAEQRAQQGLLLGSAAYATSAVSTPSIATTSTSATGDEKENNGGGANCSNYETSLLQESQLRVNKSAPAGDVSSLGTSMLSSTSMSGGAGGGAGDELQRSTFSVLGDRSGVSNVSGGSSVIDTARDAGTAGSLLLQNNSILSHSLLTKEERPSQPLQMPMTSSTRQMDSFSIPSLPAPRSRKTSEVEVDIDPQPPTPLVHHHHQQQQQQQQSLLQQEGGRSGRSAAANGSILRSKSAASAFEFPPAAYATPAMSRSSAILGGLMPRTPGYCQTPSMYRHSVSALSLGGAQRMLINDKEYTILSQLGKGGSSQVFQAFDDFSGQTVAIKVVDLKDTDDASREAFINEVELLKKLQGSRHVIKMFDYELVEESDQLMVVMEKGETDLATYLRTRRDEITPTFRRYWWEEMLHAVQFVHEHKVVHMDLKPANFLLVSGNLKLIDFGIASSIPSDKTSLLKDTQMGTLSYMSPESLMAAEMDDVQHHDDDASKFKVTAKSDVWSLGCILYTMVYGKKPFDHFKNARHKMRAISDPATQVDYNPPPDDPLIMDVLKKCLVHDVRKRASVAELLAHPYLKASGGGSAAGRLAAASSMTPTRTSPLSDESIALLANKIQSYTPRTINRKLRELVVTAQSKGGAAPRTKQLPMLELDSPPSTK